MNLVDFYPLPEGLEAQSPDEFLSNLFDVEHDDVKVALTASVNEPQPHHALRHCRDCVFA